MDDDLKYVYSFLIKWFLSIIILIVLILIMINFIFMESNLEVLRNIDSRIFDIIILIPIGFMMLVMYLGLNKSKEVN